ncbi:GIY-YIG nuclease family protein [Scytonema sp. PRP1]|jgi:excinuclease UvrABC nuclease subunit|uniref:GIY-YIG nuclease family protein n=1 Tax=Scytonema sp. PRP1 TaxID=3120513 RepID=UPI002FD3E6A9
MNASTIDPLTLPSLPLGERKQLPRCSAVYFVLAENRILYIGKTVNLLQRWAAHHRWSEFVKLFPTVRIAWLECSDETLLTEIEPLLIKEFSPELNGKKCSVALAVEVKAFVTEEVRNLFKAACARKGSTMSDTLTAFIEEFIKEDEEERNAKTTPRAKEDKGAA